MPRITLFFLLLLASCATNFAGGAESSLVVSVPDQKIFVIENGASVASYPVSTSRFGIGDHRGSYATPLGELEIAKKIGEGAALGAVFKGRRLTGEILSANARGRDPIVTRILWLRGLESSNRNAFERGIYIHGTPVEKLLGRPASYGCIRMRSRDVVRLFEMVGVGSRILILNESGHRAIQTLAAIHHPKIAG